MSCQGHAPAVARFARLNPKIAVVALASRRSVPAQVDTFVKRYLSGSRVRLVRDPTGSIAKAYGIQYHPQFAAFDAKGRRLAEGYSFVEVLAKAKLGTSR